MDHCSLNIAKYLGGELVRSQTGLTLEARNFLTTIAIHMKKPQVAWIKTKTTISDSRDMERTTPHCKIDFA